MRAALAAHDDLLRAGIEGHGGRLFKHTGDGVCAEFASPRSAVDAAIGAQRALELPVRVPTPEQCATASGALRLPTGPFSTRRPRRSVRREPSSTRLHRHRHTLKPPPLQPSDIDQQ